MAERNAPRVAWIGKSGVGKTTGLKTCVYSWLDEFGDVTRFLAWDHTIEWGESHENLHIYRSNEWELEEVCEIALELGDCTVVADEIDQAVNVHEGLKKGSAIHAIVNYGRHHRVGLIWAARRCPEVPRGLTANTGHLFVYRTDEPTDLEWLKKKAGSAVADRAAQLEPGDWFYHRC